MTINDDNLPTEQQVEWMYAEMEARLRVLVTELMTPTMQKATIQGSDLQNIAAMVNNNTKQINKMYTFTTKMVETTASLESFREEITKMDAQMHASCVSCTEETRKLRVEFEDQKKKLEREESSILHMHRCLERVTTDLNRVFDKLEESTEDDVQQQLDEQRRVLHKMICELEAKIMNVEIQHAALTDQLWGGETGLAKVTGEVKKVTDRIESLDQAVAMLKASRVQPEHLVKLKEEVKHCLSNTESDMFALRREVGNVVNDTKEHLRTALETTATQYATFMQEVRTSYGKELAHNAQLRTDVEAFMADGKQHREDVEKRVDEQSRRANNIMSEQQSVIEDEGRKRKRDRTTLDLEIKGIQKRLGGIFDSHAEITKGFEHLRNVVGKLLGAARMQCAVDLQDTEDREKVYLLGMRLDSQKEESAGPMSPGRPPSEKIQPSPRRKPKILGHQPQPIVKVDQRCLACSGSAPTVLSAFKMACLQYNPSPVDFQDSHFSRFELLFRIKDFLGSAADLYEASNTQGTMKRSDLEGTPLATPPSGALAEYSPMSLSLQKDDRTNRLPTLHRSIGKPQSRGKEMIE
mmetsp:Transcript_10449/g.19252  ORF Transcript_10449/g.19252 Transcript_10449/m.19252 type:complete len:580 (+) Transcript_10449:97-1836(+)